MLIKHTCTKIHSWIQLYSILQQLLVLESPTPGTAPRRQVRRKAHLGAKKRRIPAALLVAILTILQFEGT
jgi:hypothetical protein